MSYFEFMKKVSFNEDNLLSKIENQLVEFRNLIIKHRDRIEKFSMKKLKLLNLDYERELVLEEDDD